MGKSSKPRAGSKGYSPKVRARKETPTINNYAPSKDAATLGFIGYKAGMTHVIAKDLAKDSPSKGMEIRVPVTVIDCPPLIVFGIRAYMKGYYGPEVFTEAFAEKLEKDLSRAISVPKEVKTAEVLKKIEDNLGEVIYIRLLVHTQPRKAGIGKKTPEVLELAVGGDVKAQFAYAKGILGKEVSVKDVFKESESLDIIAVTAGKGFQGPVKRWGIKMQKRKHKRGGHMRKVGAMGSRKPRIMRWLTPQAGRLGYFNRTEFNKFLMKIGEKGDEVNPSGGFVKYGPIKGSYILLKGSVPGPRKRAIGLRKSIRPPKKVTSMTVEQISTDSKQGT